MPISFADRPIASRGKDSTGRHAYYFVLVDPIREPAFLKALKDSKGLDLEERGKVLAPNCGEDANEQTRALLKDKYGFDA